MEINIEDAPESEEPKDDRPDFTTVPVLRGKFEAQILLEKLRKLLPEGAAYICGGYVRWMCSPRYEPVLPKDVDVYCENEEVFDKVVEWMRTQNMTEASSDMSISFKVKKDEPSHPFFCLPPIQIIRPMKVARIVTNGTLESILANFDFTVIRIGWIGGTFALADKDFIEHETDKRLVIKNIHCPISSSFRFMKYYKKGYFPKMTEIVKLFLDWDGRPEDYRLKILQLVEKKDNLTEKEIMELEALMRID